MSKAGEKLIGLVALLGGIGGILAWATLLWRRQPPHVSLWLDLPLSLILGAGASMVFVFLVSNTDRSDRARLLALALLAGVFWEPIWEASRALVDREAEQSRQRTAINATQKAAALAAKLPSASPSERESIQQDIRQELQKAEQAARGIDSVSGLRQVRLASEQLLSTPESLPYREFRELLATLHPYQPSYFDRNDAVVSAALAVREDQVPHAISRSELPARTQIPVLISGGSRSFSNSKAKVAWFRLLVQTPSKVSIKVTAKDASADLIAAIYSAETLQLVESDDDSGGNRNPKIEVDLISGEYLIRVSSIGRGNLPRFQIAVAIETAGR